MFSKTLWMGVNPDSDEASWSESTLVFIHKEQIYTGNEIAPVCF